MLNQQIGQYKITKLLGEGGMAIVYLAEKGSLGKLVALKVLKEDFTSNRNVRGRFLSEARKMINLNHPNIVGVQDLIDDGDFVAIELEYIDGKTLKQHLHEKGALPDDEIQYLFKQMLDAISFVHEKGYVHRDIKPSNFMLSKNGIIKLTDFGIAKNGDDTNIDYTGTGTGMQMGTPKYMSPEQVRNTKDVDYRSDIYSLGVVLWEMVTGKVPYDIKTESTFDVFRKIVDEPLSKTGTKWDGVIGKATRKDSGQRNLELNFETEKIVQEPKALEQGGKRDNTLKFTLIAFAIVIVVLWGISLDSKPDTTTRNELSSEKEANKKSGTFTDSRDGKTYKWVEIGNQVWMAENLAYKPTSGKYWAYNNDFSNVSQYGYLYDWETACKVCPNGWHLPSDAEWTRLTDYLGGENVAGTKMKSSSGWRDNGNGSNASGFSSLPGGFRHNNGSFFNIGSIGFSWSATECDTYNAWHRYLDYNNGNVNRNHNVKGSGFSVRCIKY